MPRRCQARDLDNTLVITSLPSLPANLPPGPNDIVFTATDPDKNTATCSTVITVIDTTPPVLVGVPPDLTVPCPGLPPPATPTATDCDAVTITLAETRAAGRCADEATITRTWTAVDGSGNRASATQRITVVDTVPPVIAGCALVPEPLLPAPPNPPNPPASPRSPASATSCFSSAFFRVRCGAALDACDPAPQLAAEVIVTRRVVLSGACVSIEERIPVACDELVVLRAGAPRPPRSAASSSSAPVGPREIAGESIRLSVRAADRCGNAAVGCEVDAVASGLLCAPLPARCPVSASSR